MTPAEVLMANRILVMTSMAFDIGWKLLNEKTKNMTPAELDAFIDNKEQSVADTNAEIEAKYGQP